MKTCPYYCRKIDLRLVFSTSIIIAIIACCFNVCVHCITVDEFWWTDGRDRLVWWMGLRVGILDASVNGAEQITAFSFVNKMDNCYFAQRLGFSNFQN